MFRAFYIHVTVLHRNTVLFNNQPEALIIQIYSAEQFHPDYLGVDIRNLHETYQCRMYSRKLLMMGREDARKNVEFYNRINLNN
jgi:hypothetical protein